MTTTPATQALLPVTLEPCPFCGSDELSHGFADSGNHHVGLVKCEADGCGCFYYADDEEQAIACWNTRQAHSIPGDVGTVVVEKIETVSGDFGTEPGEPFWRVRIGEQCADFDFEQAARNFADAINRVAAFTPSALSGDAGEIQDWQKPYAEAGHDVASVFNPMTTKCKRCGTPQIDLSEDLAYGPMRQCLPSHKGAGE